MKLKNMMTGSLSILAVAALVGACAPKSKFRSAIQDVVKTQKNPETNQAPVPALVPASEKPQAPEAQKFSETVKSAELIVVPQGEKLSEKSKVILRLNVQEKEQAKASVVELEGLFIKDDSGDVRMGKVGSSLAAALACKDEKCENLVVGLSEIGVQNSQFRFNARVDVLNAIQVQPTIKDKDPSVMNENLKLMGDIEHGVTQVVVGRVRLPGKDSKTSKTYTLVNRQGAMVMAVAVDEDQLVQEAQVLAVADALKIENSVLIKKVRVEGSELSDNLVIMVEDTLSRDDENISVTLTFNFETRTAVGVLVDSAKENGQVSETVTKPQAAPKSDITVTVVGHDDGSGAAGALVNMAKENGQFTDKVEPLK